MPNRLIHESSPYLQQHANNPVDWYAWGEEALGRAKEEDRPILLSIGYSACHWCHVMEHESFEDPEIAGLMNESFVNIKVDREERPDLDSIYMQAVVAMTGHGGWPMTMFLTPDLKPFFGGTYFPPEDRHGMPGFPRVLETLAETYRTRREEVAKVGEQLLARLRQQAEAGQAEGPVTGEVLSQAYACVASSFDHQYGGLAGAPKFPQAMVFEFLLRYHARTGEQQALDMVEDTLRQMAQGGIYDQVGGGFHRYSTDAVWLVPHFEKMLYDNALLSRLYTHAYQATGRDDYARVARETFDYVLREMTGPEGGFYSTQDADSEGVEGKFFVWTPQEIDAVLGEETGRLVSRYYGVTEEGNFEGANILHVPHEPAEAARQLGMSQEDLASAVQEANGRLLEARGQRVQVKNPDGALRWESIPRVHIVKYGAYMDEDNSHSPDHELDILARIERGLEEERAGDAGAPQLHGFVFEGTSPYGTGSGSQDAALAIAAFSGMPVVRVGRADPGGPIPLGQSPWTIGGSNLDTNKARLLLMAAMLKLGRLPKAKDPRNPTPAERKAVIAKTGEFQEIFDAH